MPLTKRVEVLFEPREYRAIEELARSRGQSVGALVREAVERQLLRPSLEQRREAVQRLLALAPVDVGTWDEAKAVIERETVKRFEAI